MVWEHVVNLEDEGLGKYVGMGLGLHPGQIGTLSISGQSLHKDEACLHVAVVERPDGKTEIIVQAEFTKQAVLTYRDPILVSRQTRDVFTR